VTLTAARDWLVCEDTCIPEGADLTLTLPVAPVPTRTRSGACLSRDRDALPRPIRGWTVTATGEGPKVRLVLASPPTPPTLARSVSFPFGEGQIEPSTRRRLRVTGRDSH